MIIKCLPLMQMDKIVSVAVRFRCRCRILYWSKLALATGSHLYTQIWTCYFLSLKLILSFMPITILGHGPVLNKANKSITFILFIISTHSSGQSYRDCVFETSWHLNFISIDLQNKSPHPYSLACVSVFIPSWKLKPGQTSQNCLCTV